MDGTLGAWLAVIGLGIFHGVNPAMGWPLAVANGLTARSDAAVFCTLLPLGAGHLLAMAVVLLPFALLSWLAAWHQPLRVAAGALVMAFGVYRLLQRRHPRWLQRLRSTQLVAWSFLMATAHGAGLMLLPLTLGLCATPADGSRAALVGALAGSLGDNLAAALLVALVHTAALMACGLTLAWLVYRWLGLRFIARSWFNLDAAWALSLVVAGAAGVVLALR